MDAAVVRRPTPREHGMAMPAEWAAHELSLMAWPARLELWGDALGRAKGEYAAVARAIAGFERVLMVAAPGAGGEVLRCVRRWGRGARAPDRRFVDAR